MQINNKVQTAGIHQVAKDSLKVSTPSPTHTAPQTSMAKDVAQTSGIKKGIAPTLTGGGAGLLAGGGSSIALAAFLGRNAGSAGLAYLALPMLGAPAAAVSGAVTANVTDSKSKGAVIGAGIGAVTALGLGAVLGGGISKSFILPAATIGAGFGALGGATGAALARKD